MDTFEMTRFLGNHRHRQATAVFIFLAILLFGGPIRSSFAETIINVNTFDDLKQGSDGMCSLREAVIAANTDRRSGNRNGECVAGDGADTIVLPAGTYQLTRTDNGQENAAATGDLDLLDTVTLEGVGADVTIIEGVGLHDRIVHVIDGTAVITGITMRQGNVPGSGGGVYVESDLTLTAVTISENIASDNAGGIFVADTGTLTMSDSAIWGNMAPGFGGGLWVQGQAALSNVTISGNASGQAGGGLSNAGTTSLNFVTIAGNTAVSGSSLQNQSGNVSVSNSILSGSCAGEWQSLGHNLIQDGAGCAVSAAAGDLIGPDPLLDSLSDNGGPTPTHALLA
ncbi:MAG: CSLREA domain-containing protein, partial [Anaerolineales bacterium]|nr:CSLREA domain-containing protein [Anaerolineales bacterium]